MERLIIDEKKFYLFGRNPDVCDFMLDHQSCSRLHSALVYHKHLKRVFMIDLNSTHGTFLGRIRLEPHKPQQVPLDSSMSFGASTRLYILREKPQTQSGGAPGETKTGEDEELRGLLGFPQAETELDNLTEFNTAHNKRISNLTIEEGSLDTPRPKRRRRSSHVSFSDEEEIINLEDVDPAVGRFRNLVQTAVVPVRKKKLDGDSSSPGVESTVHCTQTPPNISRPYADLPPTSHEASSHHSVLTMGGLSAQLPNLAPDVDETPSSTHTPLTPVSEPVPYSTDPLSKCHKKKYAKEGWPGKKSLSMSLLL